MPCREGALAAPGEWGQGSYAKPDWEAASMPSDRVWLGNITASATVHSVRVVFSQFGALTDAAVFPARWVLLHHVHQDGMAAPVDISAWHPPTLQADLQAAARHLAFGPYDCG